MTVSPADIRDAALAAAATVLAAVLAPALPVLGLPLAAVALGLIDFRFGRLWSVAAAVLAGLGACLAFRDALLAIYIVPSLVAAGPLTALMLRRTDAIRTVVVVTLIVLVVLVAYEAVSLAAAGSSIPKQRTTEGAAMARAVLESGKSAPGETIAELKTMGRQFQEFWPLLWPSVYLYLTGAAALLGVGATGWIARRAGVEVRRLPKLDKVDLSFHLVWPVIAGLSLVAYSVWQGRLASLVGAIGLNLLLVVRPALFFQGMSVFAAGYVRLKSGRVTRTLGYILMVALEWFFPAISIVGVADLFINFRKMPRATQPPAEKAQSGG